ncbi:MAG TPA: hypothetical protein PKM65_16330 [Spirochaetota bacterium]|nr:hypothetical protein [Spirochaetota bacterium]HNT11777.1 hypothetical protein [Spirochaetota bacterium]
MKRSIIVLLCSVPVFFSCVGFFMISKNQSAPKPGRAIIYGLMIEMPGFGNSFSIDLYDRKNDSTYQLAIKSNWAPETSLPFAFELPAGTYELFSFTVGQASGQKASYQTYYLVKNASELKKLTGTYVGNKYLAFKRLEHDSIQLQPDKVCYVGEWAFSDLKPVITAKKELTDRIMKESFPGLMTATAVNAVPGAK